MIRTTYLSHYGWFCGISDPTRAYVSHSNAYLVAPMEHLRVREDFFLSDRAPHDWIGYCERMSKIITAKVDYVVQDKTRAAAEARFKEFQESNPDGKFVYDVDAWWSVPFPDHGELSAPFARSQLKQTP